VSKVIKFSLSPNIWYSFGSGATQRAWTLGSIEVKKDKKLC